MYIQKTQENPFYHFVFYTYILPHTQQTYFYIRHDTKIHLHNPTHQNSQTHSIVVQFQKQMVQFQIKHCPNLQQLNTALDQKLQQNKKILIILNTNLIKEHGLLRLLKKCNMKRSNEIYILKWENEQSYCKIKFEREENSFSLLDEEIQLVEETSVSWEEAKQSQKIIEEIMDKTVKKGEKIMMSIEQQGNEVQKEDRQDKIIIFNLSSNSSICKKQSGSENNIFETNRLVNEDSNQFEIIWKDDELKQLNNEYSIQQNSSQQLSPIKQADHKNIGSSQQQIHNTSLKQLDPYYNHHILSNQILNQSLNILQVSQQLISLQYQPSPINMSSSQSIPLNSPPTSSNFISPTQSKPNIIISNISTQLPSQIIHFQIQKSKYSSPPKKNIKQQAYIHQQVYCVCNLI